MKADAGLEELRAHLIAGHSWIDVRAPVEFALGHLPNAVNFPLLDDDQRRQVGTVYKLEGAEAAAQLGHRLVNGDLKRQRVNTWREFVQSQPNAIFYCFRGGLRSQISRQWLREAGVDQPLLTGGYKMARRFSLQEIQRISTRHAFITVAGATGSGKTRLLAEAAPLVPTLDLEALAKHRGSAFGKMPDPQPAQAVFENQLASRLIQLEDSPQPILLEDESRTIGAVAVPAAVFTALSEAPLLWIDESLEFRVNEIFRDYLLDSAIGREGGAQARAVFAGFRQSINNINRRLGGERSVEILGLMAASEQAFFESAKLELNRGWIEKLLVYYYDPLYAQHLARRGGKIAFKGGYQECLEFIRQGKM